MAHEPLRTEFARLSPPWHGWWTEGPYNGRIDWWTDYKFHDKIALSGRWRVLQPRHADEDETCFDAPVKESVAGYNRQDGLYEPMQGNLIDRNMPHQHVADLRAWQNELYMNSTQIKDIMAKYKISPEHPGMRFNPALVLQSTYKEMQGLPIAQTGHFEWRPTPLRFLGPRFFSSPLNEDCHIKALAGAKYATMFAMFSALQTVTAIDGHTNLRYNTMRLLGKRFVQALPTPMMVGVVGATTMCFSAMLRHRDDWKNPVVASGAVAACLAVRFGSLVTGFDAFLALSLVGVTWQLARTYIHGFHSQLYTFGVSQPPLSYTVDRNDKYPIKLVDTSVEKYWKE